MFRVEQGPHEIVQIAFRLHDAIIAGILGSRRPRDSRISIFFLKKREFELVKELGLEHMQLALWPIVELDDKRKYQELGHLKKSGLTLTAGRYVGSRLFLSVHMPIELGGEQTSGTSLGPSFELEYAARRWIRASVRAGNVPPRLTFRSRYAY